MAERKTGWLARDGKFFESIDECRQHEAREEIRAWCVEQNVMFEKLIIIIEALADPILEYVDASEKVRDQVTRPAQPADEDGTESIEGIDQSGSPEAGQDQSDEQEAGERDAPVFEQSDDRSQPMSHVGRRSRSKNISK